MSKLFSLLVAALMFIAFLGYTQALGPYQISVTSSSGTTVYSTDPTSCNSCTGYWINPVPYGSWGYVNFTMGSSFTSFYTTSGHPIISGQTITIHQSSATKCNAFPSQYDQVQGTALPFTNFVVNDACNDPGYSDDGAAFQYGCAC